MFLPGGDMPQNAGRWAAGLDVGRMLGFRREWPSICPFPIGWWVNRWVIPIEQQIVFLWWPGLCLLAFMFFLASSFRHFEQTSVLILPAIFFSVCAKLLDLKVQTALGATIHSSSRCKNHDLVLVEGQGHLIFPRPPFFAPLVDPEKQRYGTMILDAMAAGKPLKSAALLGPKGFSRVI